MILSDVDIWAEQHASEQEHRFLIDPFEPDNVQPASVDLTLDDVFLVPRVSQEWVGIDLDDIPGTSSTYSRVQGLRFALQPKQFVLASTVETIHVPPSLVGQIEGKSSLGRLGLLVHVTAGFVDPGFHGKITLEMYNVNDRPIILKSGLRICQIAFTQLSSPAERPYGSKELGSKYQNQTETTPSRYEG